MGKIYGKSWFLRMCIIWIYIIIKNFSEVFWSVFIYGYYYIYIVKEDNWNFRGLMFYLEL